MEIANKYQNWFVIQTRARNEQKTKDKIDKILGKKIKTLLPKRKLWVRRKGKFKYELYPLYPGYFFFQSKPEPEIIKTIKKTEGVIKILGRNGIPETVPPYEMRLIFNLMQEGDIVPPSQALFVNQKIKIIGGPLKGLEGKIVKVEKRKRRIKVRLPLFNSYRDVYLSYELVESIEDKPSE